VTSSNAVWNKELRKPAGVSEFDFVLMPFAGALLGKQQ